jgi:HlyD family secretion protein
MPSSSPSHAEAAAAGGAAAERQPDPDVVAVLGVGKGARRSRWLVRIGLALASIAALVFGGYEIQRRRAARNAWVFETAEVTRDDVQVSVTATGTLKGLNTVEVGAEVSGKITKVHVDFNDPVKAGQVIAEIDPEQLAAAVAEAAARVREADAAIRQAQATVNESTRQAGRARAEASEGLLAQSGLESTLAAAERAEANLASARAGATLARAALESARSRLEKTRILSPIDGVVLSRLIEPGQTVTAGFQTPVLFKLAEDLRRMSLNVLVDEADIGRTKEGQKASFTVDAYPGRVFASRLQELRNEPKSEQNVVSYEAVLAVDNDEQLLRPGMTATATIEAARHRDVLVVQNAALRFTPPAPESESGGGLGPRPLPQPNRRAANKQVWVLDGGKPKAIAVVTGASDGVVTEIVSGELGPGMKVIVDATGPR